jgi:uncharacterized protein
MNELIAAFAAFALVIVGMAVGVIFKGRRLQGSCGGLNNMNDDFGRPMCECGAKPGTCGDQEKTVADEAAVLA